MSEYGNPPPQDPNQPNPYGQQPGYGQQYYGQQPGYGGQPGYGAPAYAGWLKRVGAYLIDAILGYVAGIPGLIGYVMLLSSIETTTDPATGLTTASGSPSGTSIGLIVLGVLTGLAFFVWNTCLKQGRTGYSIGKGVLGIKLIGEQSGQPVGAGMSFVRQLAHILDSLPCNLGYLWPLWDAKKQTFADKVMSTIVIEQPKP